MGYLHVLIWLNGAIVGALVGGAWIWFNLATGRRTIKPWPKNPRK